MQVFTAFATEMCENGYELENVSLGWESVENMHREN